MADQYYTEPDVPGGKVVDLLPEQGKGLQLEPRTPVVIINRGIHAIRDKFDGRDYIIPPGYSRIFYAAAVHFRDRSVVPGSRNPETGKQESFIGIPGVDRPEKCEPFTAEQCLAFGLRVEAIAREELTSPEARDVQVVDTTKVRSQTMGRAGKRMPRTADTSIAAEHEAAREILAPPEVNEAQQAIAAANADLGRE